MHSLVMSRCTIDLLTCSLCSDQVSELMILPCQHTFCCACLRDMELGRKKGQTLSCPSCNADCQLPEAGTEALPRKLSTCSFTEMDAIREEAQEVKEGPCSGADCTKPARYHCSDGCGDLCDQCYGLHMVMPFTKKHKATKGLRKSPEKQSGKTS